MAAIARPAVRHALIVAASAFAAGLVIYVPLAPRPFAVVDFSEFLPLLTRHRGAFAQLWALVEYYAGGHGRLNLVAYVALVTKWTVLGPNPIAWQVARAVLMSGIAGAAFHFFRALGATRAASAIAAALFLTGGPAAPAWIRLTLGEPLGLAFLLAACILAAGYQTATRWRARAVAISLLLTAAVLTKEMLITAVPFALLIAVWRWGSVVTPASAHAGTPPPSPSSQSARNKALLAVTALGVGAALLAVAITAVMPGPNRFVSSYGSEELAAAHFFIAYLPILFPATSLAAHGPTLWAVGNLPFIMLAAIVPVSLRHCSPQLRRRLVRGQLLGIGLPALGVVPYLPWPYFLEAYGLPFLLGSATFIALALTSLESVPGTGRVVLGACVLSLLCGAADANRGALAALSRQQVDEAVVREMREMSPRAESAFVAVPRLAPISWQGTALTLRRYAASAAPGRVPGARDVTCSEAARLAPGVPSALIAYSDQCGTLTSATLTIREDFHYFAWPARGIRADSARVDIRYLPAGQPSTGPDSTTRAP